MKKSTVVCGVAAAVFAAAAGVTRYVVLPRLDQVPANLDVTYHYTGTADLLDATALKSGDVGHAVTPGVAVAATREVRTAATAGSAALMNDDTTVLAAGRPLSSSDLLWSVDRSSLESAPAAAGWKAVPHRGLTIGFPLNPAPQDYQYFDTPTGLTVPVHYVSTQQHGGRDTYLYTIQAVGAVADAGTVAALPPALPKPLAAGIAGTLPPTQSAAINGYLAHADALVPLSYQAQDSYNVWVDTATGVVIDEHLSQAIVAEVGDTGQRTELFPVAAVTLRMTPGSIQDSSSRASTSADGLNLIGMELPVGLLVIAVIFVALGIVLARRTAARPAHAAAHAAAHR